MLGLELNYNLNKEKKNFQKIFAFKIMSNEKNSSKKRIAIISIHSDPSAKLGGHEAGGQNVYVSELSKALGRSGWSVDVFTRLRRKRTKMVKPYAKNVNIVYIKAGPRYFMPKNKVFEALPEFIGNFLAYKTENKINYKIIHGNYYLGGWVAAQIKRICRIPMVQTFHSLGHVRHRTLKEFEKEDINIEDFKERLIAEKEIMETTDAIIATNPPEKRDLMHYYDFDLESKIKTIPCGVNLKRFRKINHKSARSYINHFSETDKIISYIGRMDWRKGIETLIRALPLVSKALPGLNLNIVVVGGKIGKKGDPDDKREISRLKEIAKALEIEKQILFLGRRDQKKLSYYYSAGDVFVIPSYYEPFGMTSLEAMRCGVPVVASNVGGLSYIIQNRKTGLLFPPKNHRILAKKIIQLFKDEKLRNKLTKNAEVVVKENYSWNKITLEMLKLYQELLS